MEDPLELPTTVPIPPNSIAARCRLARELAGRTRMEMGRTAGMSRGHYGRIENGVKKPMADMCARICRALEVYGVRATPIWLMFGTGKAATKIRKSKPATTEETQSDAVETE